MEISRGTGILPVSTSGHQGWNRHLACFNFGASGVEQASCLFQLPGGQDAHPTHIHPAPK
ncbi:MAG: hypothetical protein F6K50_13615 [Moorea sp. SIO3I7]|uniref:hypothetical protein n=1 Tax=Moorena sp. SIO3I8 TaxID=2607833 RepID=UPI0013BED501|nr:hypothetical protein [Moorena sp. SIO3I8]NEN96532.1 hypothetical protein [Moorena sp. SIO3I7]NEO07542.1 hypothetical protein [Moorena sp. SIO3I8]